MKQWTPNYSVSLAPIADEAIERLKIGLKILKAYKEATCYTEGCTGHYYAMGLCKRCYSREWTRKNSKVEPGNYRLGFTRRYCTVPGCGKKHLAKGYCRKCYSKNEVTYPDWTRDAKPGERKCMLCERLHYAKGYCKRHYEGVKRHYGRPRKAECCPDAGKVCVGPCNLIKETG